MLDLRYVFRSATVGCLGGHPVLMPYPYVTSCRSHDGVCAAYLVNYYSDHPTALKGILPVVAAHAAPYSMEVRRSREYLPAISSPAYVDRILPT